MMINLHDELQKAFGTEDADELVSYISAMEAERLLLPHTHMRLDSVAEMLIDNLISIASDANNKLTEEEKQNIKELGMPALKCCIYHIVKEGIEESQAKLNSN